MARQLLSRSPNRREDINPRPGESHSLLPDGGHLPPILQRLPDPVVCFGSEGDIPRIQSVNSAFEEAFADENAVVGTPLRDFLDRFETETDPGTLVDRTTAGEVIDLETRDDTGDRRCFRIRPVVDDDLSAGWLFFTNVTEYRGDQREFGYQDELVETFASVVSHDLRNPLDVARLRLEAARETGEDIHFEKVALAHERMEQIIQDVLTLAQQGQTINEMESVDLGTVVEDAWATVETADTSLEIVDELPSIPADPDRLQQLLENLFRNAVEHGSPDRQTASDDAVEHGGAAVTVRVGTSSDGFYVADDGPGIPDTDREQVFEPGYSTIDSTGLGLAIVDRIADAHGWHVGVMSSDAGGARFTFTGIEG